MRAGTKPWLKIYDYPLWKSLDLCLPSKLSRKSINMTRKYRRYQHPATVCVDDKQCSDNVDFFHTWDFFAKLHNLGSINLLSIQTARKFIRLIQLIQGALWTESCRAPTSPTTMDVLVDEDCTSTVARIPTIKPLKNGFQVIQHPPGFNV